MQERPAVSQARARSIDDSIGGGPRCRPPRYVRGRDLPRLLPMFTEDTAAGPLADHARLVARLRRALRIERCRGLAGDWSYDLARHAQLLEAYRSEFSALRARWKRRHVRGASPPRS
jgi:hypothetical protein